MFMMFLFEEFNSFVFYTRLERRKENTGKQAIASNKPADKMSSNPLESPVQVVTDRRRLYP